LINTKRGNNYIAITLRSKELSRSHPIAIGLRIIVLVSEKWKPRIHGIKFSFLVFSVHPRLNDSVGQAWQKKQDDTAPGIDIDHGVSIHCSGPLYITYT